MLISKPLKEKLAEDFDEDREKKKEAKPNEEEEEKPQEPTQEDKKASLTAKIDSIKSEEDVDELLKLVDEEEVGTAVDFHVCDAGARE
jgi:hypothetical protein